MRYMKLAFQYMTKNILFLLAVVIVPAILVGITTEPSSMLMFFVGFMDVDYTSFGQIFLAQSELHWRTLLISIAVVPIAITFLSGACGLVSRQMRFGVVDLKNFHRRINNNFILVCKAALILLVMSQIYAVLCSATTFFWIKIFDAKEGALVMTIIFNSLTMFIFIMAIAVFSLSVPTMSITGLGMRRGLAESASMIKGHFMKYLTAIFVPIAIPYAIICTLAAYDFWWRRFIYPIFFAYMFAYYISLLYATYCDIADVDREDLKNKYSFN